MIIVQVYRGITGHFTARASEWALAVILFNWGWILLRPGSIFASPVYAGLAGMASESVWGFGCLAVGGTRILALVVNGTFQTFHHSPHLRSVMAMLSCFVWFAIVAGLLRVDPPATGLAVYPALLALDIYNAIRAAGEARLADDQAKRRADGA